MGCGSPVFGFAQIDNNLLSLQTGLYHQEQRLEYTEKLPIGTAILDAGGTEGEIIEVGGTEDEIIEVGNTRDEIIEVGNTRDEIIEVGNTRDEIIEVGNTRDEIIEVGNTRDEIIEVGGTEGEIIDTETDTTIEGLTETAHTQLQQLGERAALYIQTQIS